MVRVPCTKRLAVGEQVGRLYTFPNDPAVAKFLASLKTIWENNKSEFGNEEPGSPGR